MMQVIEHTGAKEFQGRVWSLLLEREAENNLMIGVAGQLATSDEPAALGTDGAPRFWTVVDDGGVVAAAMVTPPYRLILTRMTAETGAFLATGLRRGGLTVPGVLGPKETAEPFVAAWCRTDQSAARMDHALRIYQLDRVTPPPPVPGRMRPAGTADFDLVFGWSVAFTREAHLPVPPQAEQVRRRLQTGEYVLWDDHGPVAAAVAIGPTPSGIRIGGVYTPPEHRRHGYSTALVAALSQQLLDRGRRFCFLFADVANPTSNRIYQKIGYRPVCDFAEYDFSK
ncbi:GNAT family N-acetyltransferase [bacterium]|nr:GNAT family N-acetyltransferase [bacterium]